MEIVEYKLKPAVHDFESVDPQHSITKIATYQDPAAQKTLSYSSSIMCMSLVQTAACIRVAILCRDDGLMIRDNEADPPMICSRVINSHV